MPLPVSIEALNRPEVKISWPDDHVTVVTPKALRLMCACAYCIEEMTGRPLIDPASIGDEIVVTGMELVGQYAVAIRFSDGHATGIYSFERLRKIG